MDRSLWTASCFLIIFGIILLGAGLGCQIYLNYKEPLKGRATAKVVELLLQEPERKDPGLPYKNQYYPVFEYYAEGKLHKVVYPLGAYPSPFKRNQEIKLKYDKSDPLNYKIMEKNTLQLAADALYAVGVVCIAAGCIIFVIFALRG